MNIPVAMTWIGVLKKIHPSLTFRVEKDSAHNPTRQREILSERAAEY